jgi:hypothetical protein
MKREGKTTWEEGGKYKELVLIVGMKAGKTVLASFIVQIEEYLLYCMGDISTKYGFMPGEEIYIINVATNEAQAKKTIFAKTRASILRSPYYKLRRPREVGCSFEFEDNHVFIVSGHSNSSSLVGNTCKLVLFDELDRFAGSGGKYSAGEVYEALVKSTDPFKEDARVVSISSLVNSKGMMTKLYANCKKISSMLGFWLPEWEMRPEDYSGKTFSFMNINIPIEHKDGFEKNPETFMRDKASVLGFTSGTYYRLPYKVKEVFESSHNKGLVSPIDEHHNFIIDLKQKDNCKYFVHGDPSKNSDSYGIALGHRENEKVIIDLVHRFKPEGIYGEINWDEVQEFCLELLRRFPSIETFTFDSWCTTGLSQTLKAQGVTVENLYVLKSQHDCLKERIYKNEFECYMYQELIDELLDLRSNGETVDHPPLGSKDVADCVAGVAWQCMYRGDSGVAPASATQEPENQSGFKNMSSRDKRRSIWD